jgi:hypothetical protein
MISELSYVKAAGIDLMHPDEEPAGESPTALHDELQERPVDTPYGSITPILANEDAFNLRPLPENGRPHRRVDTNLVNTEGDPNGNSEQRRMHYLETEVFPNFDLLFDRHGNRVNGLDWAFCHPYAELSVWQLIAWLGMTHVMGYSPKHLASRYTNYLGVDLNHKSILTAKNLSYCLEDWIRNRREHDAYPVRLRYYTSLGDISMADAERLHLPDTLEPFERPPFRALEALHLPEFTTMTLGADVAQYGHTGCYAEIFNASYPVHVYKDRVHVLNPRKWQTIVA